MKFEFITRSITAVLICLLAGDSHAQSVHPDVYVDKGACPFECCAYGHWKAEKETNIFARTEKKQSDIKHVVATPAEPQGEH